MRKDQGPKHRETGQITRRFTSVGFIILGPQENRLLLTLVERETCVFSFDETKGILQTSNQSVRHILMDLTRKGRLQRIQRGKYLLVPEKAGRKLYWAESPLVIVAHLIDVYYVGLWTAMSYWGMTDPLHGFCGNNKKEKQFGVWESKI